MSSIQDTANQALQQMLTMAVNGLQGAVDFSKAQIPDVIHQMLVWNAVSSAMVQVACLCIILVCAVISFKVIKSDNFDADGTAFIIAPTVIIAAFTLVILVKHGDWLEILLAPKYYILQQAAHLIKS